MGVLYHTACGVGCPSCLGEAAGVCGGPGLRVHLTKLVHGTRKETELTVRMRTWSNLSNRHRLWYRRRRRQRRRRRRRLVRLARLVRGHLFALYDCQGTISPDAQTPVEHEVILGEMVDSPRDQPSCITFRACPSNSLSCFSTTHAVGPGTASYGYTA